MQFQLTATREIIGFLMGVLAVRSPQLNRNPFGGCNPVADPLV
jgi:hypothetical protein